MLFFAPVLLGSFVLQSRHLPTGTNSKCRRTTLHRAVAAQSVTHDHSTTNINEKNIYNKELFSIAPMMAHTNRHYHYFWRLISKHTWLYTEMIPASQICSNYDRELVRLGMDKSRSSVINPEEILGVVYRIQREDHHQSRTNDKGNIESLYELLCSAEQNHIGIQQQVGHTTLQLGGKDPYLLGKAAAIGAAFGCSSDSKPTYSSINLNCGCPSNAVSGRSGGASLMKEPYHVAKCVESINKGVTDIYHAQTAAHNNDDMSRNDITPISVKHRLGVRDASTYNAADDKLKNDEEEALPECSAFVKAITMNGDVSKVQVHARLGLLGSFEDEDNNENAEQLWIPPTDVESTSVSTTAQPKVDHKRAQYKAKKKARQATINNRSIPPLRPGVVDMLADKFPHLEFVANGGIQSMEAVQEISSGNTSVIGSMVGRSVINHPCSFANADSLWQSDSSGNMSPSRGDVLLQYIQYCDLEEGRVRSMGVNVNSLAALRRRLVAVPFHLFVGETGNNVYQRRIRKLASRVERYTAKGILIAALNEVPIESIDKSVGEFTHMDMKDYGGIERSGPLQKSIY